MKLSVVSIVGLATSSSAFITTSNQSKQLFDTKLFERKPFITGNWKLNPKTKDEAIELASAIASQISPDSPEVALFVPFPFIECVQKAVEDKLHVGAEMCSPERGGAFTGDISPAMLESIGVQWVLAGHSERRTINKEADGYINAQCLNLLDQGMSVILCIGETLSEFELGLAQPVCSVQLRKGLAGVSAEDMSRVCIAYEPVWAIGTGKVATPEIAQDVHAAIRKIIRDIYGEKVAEEIRILYGGSVSPQSVDGLLAKPDIDGGLVGGASLTPEFGRVINFVPTIETKSKLSRAVTKVKTIFS